MIDKTELLQNIESLQKREQELKIKIHQSNGMIISVNGFLSKNAKLLETNQERLVKLKEKDLVDIEEFRKVKENIINIQSLMDVQSDKKVDLLADINSALNELKKIADILHELMGVIEENKCVILEFPKHEKEET